MKDDYMENEIEKISHIPVMLDEIVEWLRPDAGCIFLDGTLGMGGHAEAILRLIGSEGYLIALDRDAQMLARARERLNPYAEQCDFIHGNYSAIDKIFAGLAPPGVDGILLDLGLSSVQLDDPRRGFSFRFEGPLDMRMDQEGGVLAFDLVNVLSEKEISAILKDFGQERWHHRIARFIVQRRSKKLIETTTELRDVVLQAMPRGRNREKIHPATRTFQAFRIAVNHELEDLEGALDKCVEVLTPGGRMAVIAFHSLEDRIVKFKFRKAAKAGKVKLIVKKPLRPSDDEVEMNPRARSARLRIVERT